MMPATPEDNMMDKPSENLLSNALREMFRNLDIKDVTPEVIISRFSNSGGIDRVRIAIERRMKEFLESHKRHTVTASEEYLNRILSEGDNALHPQKLMQKTQDVVLATVKDRIGKDIDSVTEQGKAGWFLECIREELVNAIKGDEKVAKVEEEPVPAKPALDGAKAILSNLTRTAVRTRQADHGHDSVRQGLNKDHHINGHLQVVNGMLSQNEKQALVKGNEFRIETPDENGKKELETEADAETSRKEAKVAVKSPKHKVKNEHSHRNNHTSPDHTRTYADSDKREKPLSENTRAKGGDRANQSTKEDLDYDVLAEKILFGESVPSDEKVSAEDKPENVTRPTEASKTKGQNDLKGQRDSRDQSDLRNQNDSRDISQPGARKTTSIGGQGIQGLPEDSIMQPVTPEKHKDHSRNEISEVHAALRTDNGGAENRGSTSKLQKALKFEAAGSLDSEDMQKSADDASIKTRESPGDGKLGKDDVHSACDKMGVVEEAVDSTCDAKMTEDEALEEKKTCLDASHDDQQIEEHKSIPDEKKTIPELSQKTKDTSKIAKEGMEKGRSSSAKNGQNEAAAKGSGEANKSQKPADDNEQQSEYPKGHAVTLSRRRSRRTSSKTPAAVEVLAADLTEVAEEQSGSQIASKTKKGKASKARSARPARPARKNEEGAIEPRTARKKARKEAAKDQSDMSAKKRKRSRASEDVTQEAGQSAERPDPALENWPRGYGVTRSCVPDDYSEQQKILHALEMVLKQDYAEPFSEPVDTTEKGLEMYTNLIKNPMDLGEICKRLRNSSAGCGYYESATEVMQDVELVWWNCKKYNGQFDPVVAACDRTRQEFSFLLEQHGIAVEKGTQKRRRVSRGRPTAPQSPEQEPDLGDNDGRLAGKSILIFTELKKRKKEWFKVDVMTYDKKSKSYSLFWEETGKTTKKATFGTDKVFPVYRV